MIIKLFAKLALDKVIQKNIIFFSCNEREMPSLTACTEKPGLLKWVQAAEGYTPWSTRPEGSSLCRGEPVRRI